MTYIFLDEIQKTDEWEKAINSLLVDVTVDIYIAIYIQGCYRLTGDDIIQREFGPLLGIRNHYPKYVVSMEEVLQPSYEGIRHIHIDDFLLEKSL